MESDGNSPLESRYPKPRPQIVASRTAKRKMRKAHAVGLDPTDIGARNIRAGARRKVGE